MDHSSGDEFEEKLLSYAEKMFSHEVDLTRSKAISGLLGNLELVQKISEFDRQATTINAMVFLHKNSANNLMEVEFEKIRIIEKEIFNSLKSLM